MASTAQGVRNARSAVAIHHALVDAGHCVLVERNSMYVATNERLYHVCIDGQHHGLDATLCRALALAIQAGDIELEDGV